MPRINRLSFLSGVIALACICLLAFGHRVAIAVPSGQVVAFDIEQNADSQQPGANLASPGSSANEPQAQSWNYKRPCENPRSREESDLCQQWRMAEGTEELVALTDWQTTVRYFEVALLIITVCAAIWAALAASQAVGVARETAKQELRAYLSVGPEFVSSFDTNSFPWIRFRMSNVGKTIAQNVRHTGLVCVYPYPTAIDFVFPELSERRTSGAVLHPGAFMLGKRFAVTPFSSEEITAIQDGSSRIYVFGDLTYEHIFDRASTRFAYSVTGDPDDLQRLTRNYSATDLEISFEPVDGCNKAT